MDGLMPWRDKMASWTLIKKILYGEPPILPNVVTSRHEELPPAGLTMGTLFIGRQGTGKTSSLARHIVNYFMDYPKRAIFVLDWSGSITESIFKLILQQPREACNRLIKRLVYDDIGNPDYIIPMPEFSREYGEYEEQVQRVSNNLTKLAPELVKDAPFLAGLGLREIAPQICRILTSIVNEYDETWQLTEAKKLIIEERQLRIAIDTFGYKVPEAEWFLRNVFLNIKPAERELRSYAVIALLGAIESKETKARVGYYKPGWTAKEAIDKGLMVLVDGSRLINQKNTQHYLFTQVYSLIMAELNKRRPGNPNDEPVSLVMDEVYSLLSIPGMAEEIGMLAPLYRSRKLELYIVLQALSQLAENLKKQIWSIGNIVSFAISNFDEAYEITQQLFKYEPREIKLPARSQGQPIIEPDRGQYLKIANKIQRFKHRECIIRRYLSEQQLDSNILYIPKTRDNPQSPLNGSVSELKEFLLKQRGVSVRDSLEIINKRELTIATKKPPKV